MSSSCDIVLEKKKEANPAQNDIIVVMVHINEQMTNLGPTPNIKISRSGFRAHQISL